MFLIERVIGVLTYVIILLIVCLKLYNSKSTKQTQNNLKIFCLILSILAFFYIPANSADLSRYIVSAHIYSKYSFSELIKVLAETKAPMQILYFYVLGLTKIDGLIPAVSCMIFYGFTFRIFSDAIKRFNISGKNAALSLLFFMGMGGFLNVISIIRSCVSFAGIAYCCYFEIVAKGKKLSHIFIYIFSALMHPAAMALIIFRIILILFKKEKSNFKSIINYLLVIFFLVLIFVKGNEYVNLILDKSNTYMQGDVYSYIWEFLICLMYMIFSTYIILKSNSIFNTIELKNYKRFLILINIFIFIFSFEYSIFTRY